MQKNDKFYTFLLSHSRKSGIYIKRFSISKSVVHFGSLGLFLILGLTTLGIGISGVAGNVARVTECNLVMREVMPAC